MITNNDLLKAITDIKVGIQAEIKALAIRTETKMEEMELRINDRAKEETSKILTRFDAWAGELETAREDRAITTKQLKDHEKRIKKLERIQN